MTLSIPHNFVAAIGVALGYKAVADELLRRLSATSPQPVDVAELRDCIVQEFKSLPVEGLSYEKDHMAIKAGVDAIIDYFDSSPR
ncbi:hypothetical protein MNR02_08670 [Shinella sp. H4-D48]|uniref:hypothetical protein n=1 Tax=Shinella sp. H4-D48 TaxID=2925841 RepID=UPI001F52FD11|nr:hypothetical protein [Shinella sp. H4-D48]UNK36586.1 hypothetical protein MNR02_08670 [Shinella sp. H4-D48]